MNNFLRLLGLVENGSDAAMNEARAMLANNFDLLEVVVVEDLSDVDAEVLVLGFTANEVDYQCHFIMEDWEVMYNLKALNSVVKVSGESIARELVTFLEEEA